MTREEFLSSLKSLSGIDIPTEEQQTQIENLVNAFDASSDTNAQIAALQADLDSERTAHEELRQRFRESFWSGSPMKSGSKEPTKKSGYEVTMEDFFK